MRLSTRKSRFWVMGYLSAAFAAMIVLTWVAELTDLQRYLLGGEAHGFDWRTAAMQTWFMLAVWAASMLLMRRLVAHLLYLEGFLRVCAWCRKVGYKEKWLPLEQYFALGFDVKTTHGICPDCLKKAEEDTTRFFKRNASQAQANMKRPEQPSPH
jgi:hypothetical protein